MVCKQRIPRLRTATIIAQELKVPIHRIVYVLRTRPFIVPIARAGQTRLYDRDAVALIRHELNAIDAKRSASDG